MANNYFEKSLIFLTIMEMQTETTLSFYLTWVRVAIVNKSKKKY